MSEALKATPPRPTVSRTEPKALTRQLEVKGDVVEATVNLPEKAAESPEGEARSLLEEYGLDPEQYVVTGFRSSRWTLMGGGEGTSTRFSFGRRGTAADPGSTVSAMPDLDDLHRTVKRDKRKPVRFKATADGISVLAVLADLQVGKTSTRGGTEDLLRRVEVSLEQFKRYCKKVKPAEILLFDAGDSVENFESGDGSADRTNDAELTEQIRIWRRIFWTWIDTASRLAPVVKVAAVPSNHARVRRGKSNMGTSLDDYGIEVLSQVQDMAAVHPEKYGHVEFFAPGLHEESLAIKASGGKIVGLVHGHQVGGPDRLPVFLNGQAAGRTPIGESDIAVIGHFHSLRIQQWGGDRWLFIAPTSDNGSSWFRNISGAESAPGVMAITLNEEGWHGLAVL